MARIRSLKPEHKRHRKIGPLTDRQYRLWVGLLTEADDEGRLVVDLPQLRLEVFGYHPRVTTAHVAAALQALADAGLIELYDVAGVRYAQFPSWRDHQVVNRPRPSNCPPPLHSLNGHAHLTDDSLNDHGILPDPSMTIHGGSEGIGSDRKGSDRSGVEHASGNGGQPLTEPSRIVFKIPQPVTAALDRCPKLGAVPRLRTPTWWQAELRANPGVALEHEVFKAEAYLTAHPEKHYRRLDAYLHSWLGRADREPEP